jgi:hypothetical protein
MIDTDTTERTGGLCESCFELILDAAVAATEEAQAEPSASLSLEQYLALLDGAPAPTREERANFVEYVSHAHSWYKHLPLYPPGCPFYFFLDKYAGCDRVRAQTAERYGGKRGAGVSLLGDSDAEIQSQIRIPRVQLRCRNHRGPRGYGVHRCTEG